MTLCAGTCTLLHTRGPPSRPLFPRQTAIRLSEPLLKYRSRSDLLATLLHEGIHAYLFISSDHRRSDDPSGHGTDFQMLAAAINNHGGHQTTVAHEFHDEVESYRKHVWRCDGPCRERGPYFGEVRRAVNRAPGKRDEWWDRHERERRGKFKKVAGPRAWGAIEKWITKKPTENDEEKNGAKEVQVKEAKTPSRGIHGKRKLEDGWVTETLTRKSSAKRKTVMDAWVVRTPTSPGNSANRRMTGEFADQPDEVLTPSKGRSRSPTQAILNIVPDIHPDDSLVDCPICPARIMEGNINRHLDKVHGFS